MVRYIDTHIRETLSVEKLAARAGFSPWYFCRMFRREAGCPVMEYVRRRRLACAAAALASGRRIVDLAVEYGFQTHPGFSKAFRRYFGCPPEVYRRHASRAVPAPPVFETAGYGGTGGTGMEPEMVQREAVRIAGFALTTGTKGGENRRAVPVFWEEYIRGGGMEKLRGKPFPRNQVEYGACFPEDPEDGTFVYVIGVEVEEGREAPGGYHICTLPGGLYAVFTTPPAGEAGFSSAIQDTWDYIFSRWLPPSGYEFAPGGVDFERYDGRRTAGAGKVCDIYVPVVRKRP
jgi:AraC family transcriptional regulator